MAQKRMSFELPENHIPQKPVEEYHPETPDDKVIRQGRKCDFWGCSNNGEKFGTVGDLVNHRILEVHVCIYHYNMHKKEFDEGFGTLSEKVLYDDKK